MFTCKTVPLRKATEFLYTGTLKWRNFVTVVFSTLPRGNTFITCMRFFGALFTLLRCVGGINLEEKL